MRTIRRLSNTTLASLSRRVRLRTRGILLQLLKAAPELPWAQEALSSLSPKGKKSGMRLWPKS